MDEEQAKHDESDTERLTKEQRIQIILERCEKQQHDLKKILLRLNTHENQDPADALRKAIDIISNTIQYLSDTPKKILKLQSYHLKLHIPSKQMQDSIYIKLRFTQSKESHPLPLSHFLEIVTPYNQVARSNLITKRFTEFSFQCSFNLGTHKPETTKFLLKENIVLRLMHVCPAIKGEQSDLVAYSIIPLLQFKSQSKLNAPLQFYTADNQKTHFSFDLRASIPVALNNFDDITINEKIYTVYPMRHQIDCENNT